jgi:hypothetical protein
MARILAKSHGVFAMNPNRQKILILAFLTFAAMC